MIDDPLAMIMYAITVMAGGMYPVGFLFGACSACCDEECEECTHYTFGPTFRQLFGSVTFDFPEHTQRTYTEFRCDRSGGEDEGAPGAIAFLSSVLQSGQDRTIPITVLSGNGSDWLPECDNSNAPFTVTASFSIGTFNATVNDCDEIRAEISAFVELRNENGINDFVAILARVEPTINDCAGGVIEVPLVFEVFDIGGDYSGACANALRNYINDLAPTVTVDYKPCQCNQCTHHENAANSDGRNSYFFGEGRSVTVSVTDYGTETIYDHDQEPEDALNIFLPGSPPLSDGNTALDLGFIRPKIFIGNIESFVETDSCGCSVLKATYPIVADFRYDPDGQIRLQTIAVLPFDLCSQTTQTVDVSGSFEVLEAQGLGEGVTFDDLLAWVNELQVTVTVTVPECECGACCDDGCQDNVAEGGCDNWSGVGTSCCDDPPPCEEE